MAKVWLPKSIRENPEIQAEFGKNPNVCPYCGSDHIIKKGIRRRLKCFKQAYQCKSCDRKFVGEVLEGKQLRKRKQTRHKKAETSDEPKACPYGLDCYCVGCSVKDCNICERCREDDPKTWGYCSDYVGKVKEDDN